MMFSMNTFGHSSLVLHAKTFRIQTFWEIRQKVTYVNMTKPTQSCMSLIGAFPFRDCERFERVGQTGSVVTAVA